MTRRLTWSAMLLLFLCLTTAVAAELTRSLPEDVTAGEPVLVTLQLSAATVGQRAIISEMLPDGASIVTWRIDGAAESSEDLVLVQDGRSLIWEFTPARTDPTITYEITAPASSDSLVFDAVYVTSPTDFGRVTGTFTPTPLPVAPTAPATPAPAPTLRLAPGAEEAGLGLPLLAIYFVLLAALAYLLVRIRQHSLAKTRAHRGVAHVIGHHASALMTALGRGGARFTDHVKHAAEHPAAVPAAHHALAEHAPAHHAPLVAAAPAIETPVHATAHHAPVAAHTAASAADLDHFDHRYEKVLKRIEEYERLAKQDEAVVDLLESLKEELRSISFEYHELRGNQRVPA